MKRVTRNLERREAKVKKILNAVPREAYNKFKDETPKRTGNAKSKTVFQSTSQGGRITGNYPYANRLNEGYSKQAPDGMTDPTIDFVRAKVKRELR